jgi:hypothetical protein
MPGGWPCELTLDERVSVIDARYFQSASGRRASDKEIRDRLGIRAGVRTAVINGYDKHFGKIVGVPSQVIRRAQESDRRWCRGITACRSAFSRPS